MIQSSAAPCCRQPDSRCWYQLVIGKTRSTFLTRRLARTRRLGPSSRRSHSRGPATARCDQHDREQNCECGLNIKSPSTMPAATFRRSNRTKEPPIREAVKKPVCIVKAAHHAVGAAAATARAEKPGDDGADRSQIKAKANGAPCDCGGDVGHQPQGCENEQCRRSIGEGEGDRGARIGCANHSGNAELQCRQSRRAEYAGRAPAFR